MWLLCPQNSSDLGTHFYESGLFQNLLKKIQSDAVHSGQIVQKDDSVTFVINNIQGLDGAIHFLKQLVDHESLVETSS